MNPKHFKPLTKTIYDDYNDKPNYRHTITIEYIPCLDSFTLVEWYLNGSEEYTKKSRITNRTQKQIYRKLFNA